MGVVVCLMEGTGCVNALGQFNSFLNGSIANFETRILTHGTFSPNHEVMKMETTSYQSYKDNRDTRVTV